MGCQSVLLLVALGVFGVVVGIIIVFVILEGKVYPDFPYFCRPVGVMPPSRKELVWRLHQGGIWWEGVSKSGGVLLGLLLQRSVRLMAVVIMGSKRKFFYACVYGMVSTVPL